MGDIRSFLANATKDMNSVCELGAGIFGNFSLYQCKERVGIELIQEYINNKVVGPDLCTAAIHGNAVEFEKYLPEGFVPDVISMIDFIEHLDKDVALDLIKRAQKVAKRIVIFSPHGTHNQTGEDSFGFGDKSLDALLVQKGVEKDCIEAQRHKSKWYVKDLEDLGFQVSLDNGHHPKMIWGMKHLIGEDGGGVIWAVWNKDAK